MEEPEQTRDSFVERRRNRRSIDKIEQWLSPMSDHFPTPRGQHFLAAPILPATPSCVPSDGEPDLDNDDASSQASSSNPSLQWNVSHNRDSIMTDVTEFDDLYDVSDDEITRKQRLQANGIGRQRSSRSVRRTSRASLDMRRSLAPLVIPEDSTLSAAKKLMSPIPPTPPSAVMMSPAVKTFMELRQSQEIPGMSAPPSLDGSINSEEMAQMSAPPTPMIGAQDSEDEEWSGVRLQPGALETLRTLSTSDSDYEEESTQVIEVPQEMTEARQRLPRLITGGGLARAPSDRQSLAELTRLEIPSPGGFFSELSSASRHTWNGGQPEESNPPTSTTAENFYKSPWARSADKIPPPPPRPLHLDDLPSAIVERVIELPLNRNQEDLPTAIRVEETPVPITAYRIPPTPKQPEASVSETAVEEPTSPVDVNEIIAEYDSEYVAKQEENAVSHINRTEMWLAAQRIYLQGVAGFSDENDASEESGHESESEDKVAVPSVVTSPEPEQTEQVEPKKKAVRFSEVVRKQDIPRSLPSKLLRQESSYYRAFTDYTVRAFATDVFIHRQPRFEALQAQRVCLRDAHRNQLLGKFQLSVVPQSAKKRMSTNVVRGDDNIIDDPEKLRADKEAEALSQMHMSTWQVAATKLLNGGRLISAPVGKRLARQSCMAPGPDGVSRDRARILDLAGQGACDWAWHAALQYPNTKIYTVTTKAIRQLSNSNIRGPPNHRQVAVQTLAKLPFADDQFDLISARELHAVLKLFGEHGADEWDACLAECMRVLKPGGYLEFSLLDADIVNAGPQGNAKAVEFSFALQTLGYDPNPTRSFLGRLQTAGFDEVRRAWVCLPVGPKRPPRPVVPVSVPSSSSSSARNSTASVRVHNLEAMVSGSSENVAAITGIAAGWSWERWLLRAEMEKAAGDLRLADTVNPGEAMREAGKMIADVHAVIEEGRGIGSCFRMLKGYARKPKPAAPSPVAAAVFPPVPSRTAVEVTMGLDLDRSGSIRICLDTESL